MQFVKLLFLVIGFEIDEAVCVKMNANARTGINYYPNALGEFNEKRKLQMRNTSTTSRLFWVGNPLSGYVTQPTSGNTGNVSMSKGFSRDAAG